MRSAFICEICGNLHFYFPQIEQIAADLRRKRQDRGMDFRPEGSHNARRIILTGGRFLLNDA
jgi:hypothetical protein